MVTRIAATRPEVALLVQMRHVIWRWMVGVGPTIAGATSHCADRMTFRVSARKVPEKEQWVPGWLIDYESIPG